MARKAKAVIVDSYAIMADLLGQAPQHALRYLDKVRLGEVRGYVHYLLVYELAYHWRRGRLPFADEKELREFIDTYFRVLNIDAETALEASKVKIAGDRLLREAEDKCLRARRLSAADATTIALALKLGVPVITGDNDLTYVARALGVKVIWG